MRICLMLIVLFSFSSNMAFAEDGHVKTGFCFPKLTQFLPWRHNPSQPKKQFFSFNRLPSFFKSLGRAAILKRNISAAPLAGDPQRLKQKPIVVGQYENPLDHLPPSTSKRLVVAVFGSDAKHISPKVFNKMERVGQEIARKGHVVLTGACDGIPQHAVRGAKMAGGLTVGISPWQTLPDHLSSRDPYLGFDVLQLTEQPPCQRGQNRPNLMSREIDNVERADMVIIAGGRNGTLGEFAIAFQEKRPIGVLLGTGGISKELKKLVKTIKKAGKTPGAPIIFDRNPARLVNRLIETKMP